MTDDRKSDQDLERYLKGDSKLSRAYRDASRENAPRELDEAILAYARREARAKPGLSRALAPVALAASLILGVNLAWNLHNAAPPVAEVAAPKAAPAGAPADLARAQEQRFQEAKKSAAAKEERDERQAFEQRLAQEREPAQARREPTVPKKLESRAPGNMDAAGAMSSSAPAPAAASPVPMMKAAQPAAMADAAPPPPLTEPQKIDRLIAYVGSLQGAVFIRNGAEHTPAQAVEHMKLKRDKAGDRIKTADDFIKYCASHSTLSGEAYLIRFPDGRTRTAEDVLREELARINASAQ